MKFFYLVASQFVTVFLSPNTVTNLHFNKEISYCDIGVDKNTVELVYRRNSMSVSIVPKSDHIKTNMTCYSKDWRIYVFNIKTSKEVIHKDLVLNDATLERGGKKIYSNSKITIYDSGKNYFIENNSKSSIRVNESIVEKSAAISKWSPVIVDDMEIHL